MTDVTPNKRNVAMGYRLSRMRQVLKTLDATGEVITFEEGKAFMWVEPISLPILNEMLAHRTLSPVPSDGEPAFAINEIGRAIARHKHMGQVVRAAIKTGKPFTAREKNIIWLS